MREKHMPLFGHRRKHNDDESSGYAFCPTCTDGSKRNQPVKRYNDSYGVWVKVGDCFACAGTGGSAGNDNRDHDWICETCNGTGTCPTCDGSGTVYSSFMSDGDYTS